jgi:CheY-like chemotaxis protein
MENGGRLTIETADMELDEGYAHWHADVVPGRYVLLAISDTGSGMDAETLSHIFEPFFTTKAPDKGTGLGLATVYGIVHQSGGHVWVYSEPGKGTTFKVYFPCAEPSNRPAARTGAAQARSSRGETILLVEDEASVRALTRLMLVEQGYFVIEAKTGEEAIELSAGYEGGTIDLLITDVIMPGMSGKDLALRIAESRPDTKVLFMSGYTDTVIDRHDLLGKGVYFLEKPFGSEALAIKLRQALEE